MKKKNLPIFDFLKIKYHTKRKKKKVLHAFIVFMINLAKIFEFKLDFLEG